MKNNKGTTLIETMIAVGLASVVVSVIFGAQLMISREKEKLSRQLDATVDTTIAERNILLDLRQVDPSYNNLILADDNGQQFFDYYPDIPENLLGNNIARTLTLDMNGITSVDFLIEDINAGPLLIYDPVAAYLVGPPPASFNQPASLTFVSLNNSNWVSANRPDFWVNNQLLLLDTTARVRPTINNTVNLLTRPRSPIYIGKVNGQDLVNDTTVVPLINITDPLTGANITSVDTFLRNIPSTGGGIPLVRLRAVRLMRYFLQSNGLQGTSASIDLYRQSYVNNAFTTPHLIATKVKSIAFKRNSVTQKIIHLTIEKVN